MATLLLTAQDARVASYRKELLRDKEQIERTLAELEEVPILPEPTAEGSVIRFRKYDRKYWFAAIKIGAYWYTTQDGSRSSRQGQPPRLWSELIDWIGDRNYETVEVLA